MRQSTLRAFTTSGRHALVGSQRAFSSCSCNADIAHRPHTHTHATNQRVIQSSLPHELSFLSDHLHSRPLPPFIQPHRHHSTFSPALSPPQPQPIKASTSSTAASTTPSPPTDISQHPNGPSAVPRSRFACTHCSKTYAARGDLVVHQIQAHNIHISNHFCQPCPYCQQLFADRLRLQQHINRHTGETPFSCPHCDQRYAQRSSLTTHIKYAHQGPPRYTCIECPGTDNVLFQTREQARRHYLQYHSRGSSPRQSAVRVDSQGRERHICSTCNIFFSTAAELLTHNHDDHVNRPRPFACPLCTASFDDEYRRRLHLIHVHQQRPTEPNVVCVECPVCARLFSGPSTMQRHLRSHTGEKPYACERCGRAYQRRDYWLRHMREKHGVVEKRSHRSNILPITVPVKAPD